MFPLGFHSHTSQQSKRGDWVAADPFCGRGTTNFAARLLGLPSLGIDSSSVAVALSKAKLAYARVSDMWCGQDHTRGNAGICIRARRTSWSLAYDRSVLRKLCWLRRELILDAQFGRAGLVEGDSAWRFART